MSVRLPAAPSIGRHPAAVTGAGTVLGVLAVLLAAVCFTDSVLDELTLWLIESLLALSLVLVWGRAGIFSLGQSALYGLGAYAFGVVAVNLSDAVFLPWALLTAAAVAGLTAAVIGYFVFYGRVSELNVAIITLAFTLVTYAVLNNLSAPKYAIGSAELGGFNGMVGIPPFRLGGASSAALTKQQVFVTVGIVVVVLTAAVAVLARSPFGRVVAAVRSNETRAELLGVDVRRYRLLTFVLGGVLAGIGGGLFAAWGSFVSPGLFTLQPAVLVIIWVLVGGRSYLLAGVVGTVAVEALTSWLGGSQGQYSPIYLGAALIAVVLLVPGGILGGLAALIARLRRDGPEPADPAQRAPSESPVGAGADRSPVQPGGTAALSVAGLRKSFGGFTAVDGVELSLRPSSVRCVIGPNGAGKSTLFALLVGTQRASAGRIEFGGRQLNRMPPFRRARLGMGIKLQTASVFDELTARENLWIAGYSLLHRRHAADRLAERMLAEFGLDMDAERPAGTLAHGRQQWLEIAMVAARRPSVVLLDEPTAGMSTEETSRTADLVRALAESASVVVIEHDMAFVRQLDAEVTVLHLGRELLAGALADIEASDEVRAVYLGGGVHAEA
jgi:branched-chain amino acid transport system permease protein